MSNFGVFVKKIESIEAHPNADVIELAVVGDYRSIIKKGQFKQGDLVVYIPEQSIVPNELLQKIGLEGKLAGSDKNRVCAIRLRGCVSQGICIEPEPNWILGQDVTKELGITKYEPIIPAHLTGEVFNVGTNLTINYDIENYKTYPHILQNGEEVIFTEKIHGTFAMFIRVPLNLQEKIGYRYLVASKGLGASGLVFKFNEKNKDNLYIRTFYSLEIDKKIDKLIDNWGLTTEVPITLCGEIFGKGVQDLSYGKNSGYDNKIGFRAFDMAYGFRHELKYFDSSMLDDALKLMEIERVPLLYKGPFLKQKMIEYTAGKETISGDQLHIREGIVIRPSIERACFEIGRVQLKSVSEDYLLRKGGTEYN